MKTCTVIRMICFRYGMIALRFQRFLNVGNRPAKFSELADPKAIHRFLNAQNVACIFAPGVNDDMGTAL